MSKMDNYIRYNATLIKEGIDKGEIKINKELLQKQKDGVIDYCLKLDSDMSPTQIGLLVDKIFDEVLENNNQSLSSF